MINRDDMLELTRRMTPKRSSIDRIAGCYFDQDKDVDGTFNKHFLKLSPAEQAHNLKIAKTIPFSATNDNLIEIEFPNAGKRSKDMKRLLDGMKEVGLKNDALMDTFYDVIAENQPEGTPFAILVFHGIYDIPIKGNDKEEQWESEEIYDYLICAIAPVYGDYEVGEPTCGFLYPSFKNHSTDWERMALYERIPGRSGRALLETIGCVE